MLPAQELVNLTAEDVKNVLEAYQREHFPTGRCACAQFDTGPGRTPETLVIVLPNSSASAEPESPSGPARSAS